MTNKKLFFSLILSAVMCVPFTTNAQITVGSGDAPQNFSVLELISNQSMGLRLPQMTTQQRNDMRAEFGELATTKAVGLQIFNTTNHCVEVWNGTGWISMCGAIQQPNPASVSWLPRGANHTFILGEATGTDGITYQWQSSFDGVSWEDRPLPAGRGLNYTISNVTEDSPRHFRRIARAGGEEIISETASIVTLWAIHDTGLPGRWTAPGTAGMHYQWNRRVAWSSGAPRTSFPAGVGWDNGINRDTNWADVNDPCPPNWRIPAHSEWMALVNSSTTAVNANEILFTGSYGQELSLPVDGGYWDNNGNWVVSGLATYATATVLPRGHLENTQYGGVRVMVFRLDGTVQQTTNVWISTLTRTTRVRCVAR